jgi:tubulin epsilon
LLCLANNTCVRHKFIQMRDKFSKLYTKRKLYTHHYKQYMDESHFDETL